MVDDPDISVDAARALHRDAVQLKRHELMFAAPMLILAVPIGVLAIMMPRELGFFAFVAGALVFHAGRTAVEFVRLRRAEPVENWRREQRDEAADVEGRRQHLERAAAVRPWATLSLVGVTMAVTAVQFLGPGIRESIGLAALVKPAVRAGEWWRLLSAGYLHGNLMHVLGNMSALCFLGEMIEIYDRPIRLPLAYLAAVIGGSLASTFVSNAPSVGASGGVLGLAGYLLMSGRLRPDGTTHWVRRRIVSMLAATAALGVAAFFFIDNAAHVGGALAGAGVGWLSARADRQDAIDRAGWVAAVVLAGGACFTVARLLRLG
jgi:membrane associated rhomboid family serine protease